MQRMWRQLFAAIVGVVVVAGTASAQTPPRALPSLQVSPTPVKAETPAPAANNVTPAAGGFNAVNVRGLAPRQAIGAVVNQPGIPYGHWTAGCANGCGNLKGDLGFMFGSCKSYFEPCGPGPCDGPTLRNRARCGVHPFSTGYNSGCAGCTYDSVLNH